MGRFKVESGSAVEIPLALRSEVALLKCEGRLWADSRSKRGSAVEISVALDLGVGILREDACCE